MLQKLTGYEAKINESQQKTIEIAVKDKNKTKKLEDEMMKITQEYDQTREKDVKVLDQVTFVLKRLQKIKDEVQHAILTISEKRYRAEMEVEKLKKTVEERDTYIKELELKMAEL